MVRLHVPPAHDPLKLLRRWIDRVEARHLPVRAGRERAGPPGDAHPPMGKLNPFYEQVAALRFRCLSVLETSGRGPSQA